MLLAALPNMFHYLDWIFRDPEIHQRLRGIPSPDSKHKLSATPRESYGPIGMPICNGMSIFALDKNQLFEAFMGVILSVAKDLVVILCQL